MRLPLLLFLFFEVSFSKPNPTQGFSLSADVLNQIMNQIKIIPRQNTGEATPTGEACDNSQLQPQNPQPPKYQFPKKYQEGEIRKQVVPNVQPNVNPLHVYKRKTDEYAQQPEAVYQPPSQLPPNFGNQHGQEVYQRQQFSELRNQGEEYASQQTPIQQQPPQEQDQQMLQQQYQKQLLLKQQHEQRMQHMRQQQQLMQQRQQEMMQQRQQDMMQQRLNLQEEQQYQQQQEPQEYEQPEDGSQQKTYFRPPQMPPMPPMPQMPQMTQLPFDPQQMPQRFFPREGGESPYQQPNLQQPPVFAGNEEGTPPYQFPPPYTRAARHPADSEAQPAERKTSRQVVTSGIRMIRPSDQ